MKKIILAVFGFCFIGIVTPLAFAAGNGLPNATDDSGNKCFASSAINIPVEDIKAGDYPSGMDKNNAAVKQYVAAVLNNDDKNKPKVPVPELYSWTCNGKVTYVAKLGASSLNITDLPSLFDGKDQQCTIKADEGISCTFNGGSMMSLLLPACELFEQGVTSNQAKDNGTSEKYKTYACTELIDPMPANFFDAGTYCVSTGEGIADTEGATPSAVDKDNKTLSYKFTPVDKGKIRSKTYCSAILTPTGQQAGGLFSIVRMLYDLSLPILIALAVISMVGIGVFIMYAPGGGEDTIKKAKETALRVFMGLMLLLFLRVFLSLISFDFFGTETPPATPAGQPTAGAGGSTAK